MKDIQAHNTLNTPYGRVAVALVAIYSAWRAIAHVRYVVSEIAFYSRNSWDFEMDTGNPCWMQDRFVSLLGYLPIGKVKLIGETCWFAIQLIILTGLAVAAFS